MMEYTHDNPDKVLGERMKTLRSAQAMTLDDLAQRASVSRAMISRIERGEASPTAQLLARLCGALGTTLSRFFATDEQRGQPLLRRGDQRFWRDPATGYLRRSVSPDGMGSPVDIFEVEFPPGASVVFGPQQFDDGVTQHLWLFEGRLTMTTGKDTHLMEAGDCLFMRLSDAHAFHNPHGQPARYAVILNRSKV